MTSQCTPPGDGAPIPSDCEILEGYRARVRQRQEEQNSPELTVALGRAAAVRLLLLDVDGVLTDGSLMYSESGVESKTFNTQDGLGIRLVQKADIDVGVVTARQSPMVKQRAEELGMRYIRQGVASKHTALKEILQETGLKPAHVCYVGDDWIDLALLTRVGFAACPANAVVEVQQACHYVARRGGGFGAVREICDLLLRAKGVHAQMLQYYL